MKSIALTGTGLACEGFHGAMQQATPGSKGVGILEWPETILGDHLFPELHQQGVLDTFALMSRQSNAMSTQWRVRETFKDIAAGLALKAPQALDEPAQGAALDPVCPPGPPGQLGSALRALQRMRRFLLGVEAGPLDFLVYGLKKSPPPGQVGAHLDNLRTGASARMQALNVSTWLPTEQRNLLLGDIDALRHHFFSPLTTWAFAEFPSLARSDYIIDSMADSIETNKPVVDLQNRELRTAPPLGRYYDDGRVQDAWLSGNRFVKVPNEIMLFENLEVLDLAYNQLDELPEELARLRKLRELHLNNNALTTLSPVVFGLPALQVLRLFGNPLIDVANGYAFAASLEMIDIDNASLPLLGPALRRSSGLNKVRVRCGETEQEVSGDIRALERVETLIVVADSVTTLPPDIGYLKSLKFLWIVSESLRHLPEEMGALQNLERLDLRRTGITSRPPQLLNLPSLTQLFLPGDGR